MTLELKSKEMERLNILNSGRGFRSGKGLYTARPDKVKITADQVIEVKRCFAAGMYQTTIMNEMGLSEYIVSGVKKGRYDFVIEAK